MKTLRFLIPVLALLLALTLATAPMAEAQSGNVWRLDFQQHVPHRPASVLHAVVVLSNWRWGLGSPAPPGAGGLLQRPLHYRRLVRGWHVDSFLSWPMTASPCVDDVIYIDTYNAPQPVSPSRPMCR